MRGDTLVVFAKAPRLGTVKRRLAAGIGAAAALRFYRATLARVLLDTARDRRFTTVLATTPRRATGPWAKAADRWDQGSGDLGVRMARAFAARPRGRVVLVGSDIPDLRPADVAAAFRALGRADAVFGPALDGGYYLVGMGPCRPAHPFRDVRWSSPHALADTRRNFAGRRVALLRVLRDVDDQSDFDAWRLRAKSGARAAGA